MIRIFSRNIPARFMIFLMVFAMVCSSLAAIPTASAAANQIVAVSTGNGTPEETVQLNLTMNDGVGLSAIQFTVNYNSKQLSVSEADNDFDGLADAIVPATGLNLGSPPTVGFFDGYINFIMYRPGGVAIPEGAAGQTVNLVGIKFAVKKGAINGSYPITVTNLKAFDYDGKQVVLGDSVPGSITITGGAEAPSDKKAITAFDFANPAATGVVDEVAKTVALTVPYGTDVTNLVPTIAVSEHATVSPTSGTAGDFTNPVTYTVTAQDGSKQVYKVTVNITPPSTNCNLNALVLRSGTTGLDFTPAFASGTTAYNISVGNAITSVTVTPTVADATATVTVNEASVTSGQASGAINLNNTGNTPNTINVVVTAQDGTTTKTYAINVLRADAVTAGVNDPPVTVNPGTPVTITAEPGAKIDVDETQALPLIEVNTADSTVGTIQVSIPAGTTVSGPAGWTGEINLPAVVTVPVSSVTGASSVAYAIEIGDGDNELTFSQAVRVLMPGAKGKRVGVISGGVFTEITALVAADTQAEGNKVTKHGKIEVGNDVAIWTKHFTKFVVYIPATTPPTSGGGGGGGGGATPFNGTSVTAADGGTVSNSSLGASVVIPANAMASNFKVRIEKASTTGLVVPDNSKIVGDVVEILKDDSANFTKAVTVKLSFDKSKVNLDENTLSLYWYNTSTKKWVELDNVKVDAEAGKVSGEVKQFAKFAILATTKEAPVKPEPKPETPKVTLTDIAGHWAQADIQKLVAAGAISGYPNKTFKPNNNITRAEFAVTLVKALKLAPKSGKVFNDTANHWAKDSIATAQAYGIISGYSDTKFGPNDNITREQMAVMITKAASLKAAANAKTFTDSAKVSAWAKDAVIAASSNGIISGYPDGSFKPKANATRAEAATMIVKIMK